MVIRLAGFKPKPKSTERLAFGLWYVEITGMGGSMIPLIGDGQG